MVFAWGVSSASRILIFSQQFRRSREEPISLLLEAPLPPMLCALVLTADSLFTHPSSLTDHVAANLLSDHDLANKIIKLNRQRLAASFELVATFLRNSEIPFHPGSNSVTSFVWLDLASARCANLSERHPTPTANIGRKRGWSQRDRAEATSGIKQSMKERKLFLGSDEDFSAEECGWFRLVFSHSEQYLIEGLKRLLLCLHG